MHDLHAVVDLSRWQFAATALYHFLFVPLTLGLSFILAAMETVYVTTGRQIYKDMARFWGKLFAINFALGVATGLTMEFEFGTNWSGYSHFVGDVFGAPLAIEGLMAFFLESTFVGLMLFGWDRMSRGKHLLVTFMVALGSNLSAVWILVANGFMQAPHGAAFNPVTMRMELTSFTALIFNHDAQAKFVHTSIAGYVTAAIFVAGVSGWYMLRGRHMELAKRSFRMAVLFGVFASVGVISLGDALGFIDGSAQPAKLVAMEGLWKTEQPPAGFNLIAIPSQKEQRNLFQLQVPKVLTPLVTHTMDTVIPGADAVEQQAKARMANGIPAALALQTLSKHPHDQVALAQFRAHEKDLGYALLLQRYAPDLNKATPADYERAARDVIPNVPILFWSFRIMVLAGFAMLIYLGVAAFCSLRNTVQDRRGLLKIAPWFIPVPYIACEVGWLVAEMGRQPWTVYGVLPTWMSASTHSLAYMVFSLAGFVLIYTAFIIVEIYLMLKFIRKGPDEPTGTADDYAGGPALAGAAH
ncbi:MAG: cytochrome ubiquinol oxidase subunit I [Gammaproteobacteria bacterium]